MAVTGRGGGSVRSIQPRSASCLRTLAALDDKARNSSAASTGSRASRSKARRATLLARNPAAAVRPASVRR